MSALLVGLLVWIWAAAVGDKVLRGILRNSEPTSLDSLVLGVALGTGVLGIVGFALGVAGAYRVDVIWLLVALTFVINWRYPWRLFHVARACIVRVLIVVRSDRRFALLLVALLIAMALRLLAATAPPTGIDTLVYHLPLPQTYIAHQRMVFVPDILLFGGFPQHVEMLYTLALLLGPDSTAQVVHWGFGVVIVVVLYRLGRRYLNEWQSLLVAGTFYAIGDVAAQSSLAMADLAVALYQLLAVTMLLRYLNERRMSWLVLSGLFIGFAAGSKYMGGLIGVALVVLLLWEVVHHRLTFADSAKAVLILGGIGGALWLPWLLKNWVLIRNPVSPFLTSIFSSQPYAAELAAWVELARDRANAVRSAGHFPLLGLLITPLRLTYQPETLGGSPIGPIFLAALPFLPWALRTLDLRRMVIVAVTMLPLWYFTARPHPRYVLVSLALLTVPVLVSLYRIGWRGWAEKLISALVFMWCIFGMIGLTLYYDGLALSHVMQLGAESRPAYLTRALPARFSNFHWYPDILWLNDNLPPGSLVLVEDNRLPDLQVPARRLLSWVDSWGSAPSCYHDLNACLCDSGFTHVVMRQDWFGNRWYAVGQGLEVLISQGELTLLHKGKQMTVYQVQCRS